MSLATSPASVASPHITLCAPKTQTSPGLQRHTASVGTSSSTSSSSSPKSGRNSEKPKASQSALRLSMSEVSASQSKPLESVVWLWTWV